MDGLKGRFGVISLLAGARKVSSQSVAGCDERLARSSNKRHTTSRTTGDPSRNRNRHLTVGTQTRLKERHP
jgi:hypothetical protein